MVVTSPATVRKFQRKLLAWYDTHARDLPWRQSADPYRIWVSEIMLQQTRVAAVLDYYARFLTLFPSVAALAKAQEPDVLAAWSGLGYYRRAKLMHKAAKVVVMDHRGVIPRTAEELRKLPGIGEYTSSAIASIAFGEPVAVVDGNVERVLLRVFPDNEKPPAPASQVKWLRNRAANVLDTQRPLCLHCPLQQFCTTRGEHQAPPPKKMRSRLIAYALLRRHRAGVEQVMLEQRPLSASLMPGMWELPEVAMLESDQERVELTVRHSITITNYQVRVLRFAEQEANLRFPPGENLRQWTRSSELSTLPLTGLTRKVLQRLQIMTKEVR
jgi:A/G-specific adenine glycosylase